MSEQDLVSRAVEGAVNRYLSTDDELRRALEPLAGRMVALEIEGTGLHLACHFVDGGVLVRRAGADAGDAPPDVQVRGTPLALARLLREGGADPTLGGQVRIHGDMEVAQRLSRALHGFDLDWEELLSRFTGDVAAHQVGRAVRGVGRFAGEARVKLERDLGEFLVEEQALTPRRDEVQDFVTAVDDLRDDVERMEKRVQRLLRRVNAGDGA